MKTEEELYAHSATIRRLVGVQSPGVLVATIAMRGVVSADLLTIRAIERAAAATPGVSAYVLCFDRAVLTGGLPAPVCLDGPMAYVATTEQLEVTRNLRGFGRAPMPLVFSPQQIEAARRWVALEAAAARR